jgi:hypothetical protein
VAQIFESYARQRSRLQDRVEFAKHAALVQQRTAPGREDHASLNPSLTCREPSFIL